MKFFSMQVANMFVAAQWKATEVSSEVKPVSCNGSYFHIEHEASYIQNLAQPGLLVAFPDTFHPRRSSGLASDRAGPTVAVIRLDIFLSLYVHIGLFLYCYNNPLLMLLTGPLQSPACSETLARG